MNLTGDENYVILDANGTGHYVGCVLSIDNFDASSQPYTWPGEGDDMIFIDGDTGPRPCTAPEPRTTSTRPGASRAALTPAPITGSPWPAVSRNTSACGACTDSTSRTRCGSGPRSGSPSSTATPTTRATTTPASPTGTRSNRTPRTLACPPWPAGSPAVAGARAMGCLRSAGPPRGGQKTAAKPPSGTWQPPPACRSRRSPMSSTRSTGPASPMRPARGYEKRPSPQLHPQPPREGLAHPAHQDHRVAQRPHRYHPACREDHPRSAGDRAQARLVPADVQPRRRSRHGAAGGQSHAAVRGRGACCTRRCTTGSRSCPRRCTAFRP